MEIQELATEKRSQINMTASVNQSQIKQMMDDYVVEFEHCEPTRPLLFWFEDDSFIDIKKSLSLDPEISPIEGHPLKQGNKYMLLNGEPALVSQHSELLDELVLPNHTEETRVLLYHRYIKGAEKEQLEYCFRITRIKESSFPVVGFMDNAAAIDATPEDIKYINDHFISYLVEPIL